MKRYFSFFVLLSLILLSACDEETSFSKTCNPGTLATVKDLTGLDGCGFVFELTDGTRLEPMRLMFCGTNPLPKEVTEDPLYDFQFLDGKQVRIGYEEINDAASICMAGKIVKITCIEEIKSTE
jgi:hypothetical protein